MIENLFVVCLMICLLFSNRSKHVLVCHSVCPIASDNFDIDVMIWPRLTMKPRQFLSLQLAETSKWSQVATIFGSPYHSQSTIFP